MVASFEVGDESPCFAAPNFTLHGNRRESYGLRLATCDSCERVYPISFHLALRCPSISRWRWNLH